MSIPSLVQSGIEGFFDPTETNTGIEGFLNSPKINQKTNHRKGNEPCPEC